MQIRHWRLADGPKADLVIARGLDQVDAIECKWNPDAFEPRGLKAFRENYPKGRNFLLSPGVRHRSIRNLGGLEVVALPIEMLREEMVGSPAPRTG